MADVTNAINYVLKNEDSRLSGVVTVDRGGRTRFGIAQNSHPNIDPSFYTVPKDQALKMADAIYASEYASPLKVSLITSQAVANKILDFGVNAGTGTAAKILERAVSALGHVVTIDGAVGPATVAAVNGSSESALLDQLVALTSSYYKDVAARENAPAYELKSWLTRAALRGV